VKTWSGGNEQNNIVMSIQGSPPRYIGSQTNQEEKELDSLFFLLSNNLHLSNLIKRGGKVQHPIKHGQPKHKGEHNDNNFNTTFHITNIE
jgi:hypothetical protein